MWRYGKKKVRDTKKEEDEEKCGLGVSGFMACSATVNFGETFRFLIYRPSSEGDLLDGRYLGPLHKNMQSVPEYSPDL